MIPDFRGGGGLGVKNVRHLRVKMGNKGWGIINAPLKSEFFLSIMIYLAKKSLVSASKTSTQKQKSPLQIGMSILIILYLLGLCICKGGSKTSKKSES